MFDSELYSLEYDQYVIEHEQSPEVKRFFMLFGHMIITYIYDYVS